MIGEFYAVTLFWAVLMRTAKPCGATQSSFSWCATLRFSVEWQELHWHGEVRAHSLSGHTARQIRMLSGELDGDMIFVLTLDSLDEVLSLVDLVPLNLPEEEEEKCNRSQLGTDSCDVGFDPD